MELQKWSERGKSWSTYHRYGEGDDGVTVGARDAARSETRGKISQVATISRSQAGKHGEGENVFHFESNSKIWRETFLIGKEEKLGKEEKRRKILNKKRAGIMSGFQRIYGNGGYYPSGHLSHDRYVEPPLFNKATNTRNGEDVSATNEMVFFKYGTNVRIDMEKNTAKRFWPL